MSETIRMRPKLIRTAILFVLSFLVTAIFSASLVKFFAAESLPLDLSKGFLIPGFTWTVQLVLSALLLRGERLLVYWEQLGVICLVGSVALLPAAVYNFASAEPSPWISAANVLASVALMGATLYFRLRARGFRTLWTVGWTATIIVNMSLYLYSVI